MDNFKKYIQENKLDLDLESPDPQLWNRVEKDLLIPKKSGKHIPITRWVAAAACVAILFVGSYFLLEKGNQNTAPTYAHKEVSGKIEPLQQTIKVAHPNLIAEQINTNPAKINKQIVAKSEPKKSFNTTKYNTKKEVARQYVIEDVEVGNFSQVVAYERQYINTLPIYGEKPSYFNDFKQQLNQMDRDEKNVRNDIKKHGLNPSQIEILINIYQQKITLLKQLNKEITRVNKSFSQQQLKKDSSTTSNPHFLNL